LAASDAFLSIPAHQTIDHNNLKKGPAAYRTFFKAAPGGPPQSVEVIVHADAGDVFRLDLVDIPLRAIVLVITAHERCLRAAGRAECEPRGYGSTVRLPGGSRSRAEAPGGVRLVEAGRDA
jgi:hypothetical protein